MFDGAVIEMKEKEEIERTLDTEQKMELLAKSSIALWIDGYDDIFSDFDHRPYSQRALSDDFLFEAKKASKDKLTGIEIKFLMPKKERNVQHEYLIRKRLRAHFKKHSDLLEMEIKQLRIKGLLMAVFGVVMIFVAASLLFAAEQNYLIRFLEVLLEPAGWFTAWTGLDQIFYKSNEKKPDLEFYDKMMHADIVFLSY